MEKYSRTASIQQADGQQSGRGPRVPGSHRKCSSTFLVVPQRIRAFRQTAIGSPMVRRTNEATFKYTCSPFQSPEGGIKSQPATAVITIQSGRPKAGSSFIWMTR